MNRNYLFCTFTTYLLLILFKNTTFFLLLSSNTGKVAEFWTLAQWAYEKLRIQGITTKISNQGVLVTGDCCKPPMIFS